MNFLDKMAASRRKKNEAKYAKEQAAAKKAKAAKAKAKAARLKAAASGDAPKQSSKKDSDKSYGGSISKAARARSSRAARLDSAVEKASGGTMHYSSKKNK